MDTLKKLFRSCPICTCEEGKILHTQRFILPEGHLLPSEYDVVNCENCGFVFADTQASQKIYDRYYTEMSKYEDVNTASGGGDKHYDLHRLNEMADRIEQILSKNYFSSILDIGCGNGGLIKILYDRGYKNVVGLDPSVACVDRIRNQGIEAHLGGLFSENKINKRFDILILSHVFEHIYDLGEAVTNLKDWINTEGLIYVETPDASKYPEYYIVPYYYFDTEHINHFSKLHHQNLFGNLGFELVKSDQLEIMVSEKQKYPAVFSVFKYIGIPQHIKPDFSLVERIKLFTQLSTNSKQVQIINEYFLSQIPIIIWGAGNYTLRLLSDTNLKNCNIVHFVDSDSKKWGLTINGKPIFSPSSENLQSNDVLVCSALHGQEISKQLGVLNPTCKATII
jgi:2-polyprenyl-3-methyl-5-hydroxy-6-metoxy-1,4-benzoquinol methylase